MNMCVGGGHTSSMGWMWSLGTACGVNPLLPGGFWELTLVLRFGGRHRYSLSHLAIRAILMLLFGISQVGNLHSKGIHSAGIPAFPLARGVTRLESEGLWCPLFQSPHPFLFVETRSHMSQAGWNSLYVEDDLKLQIFQPLPPKCWGYA
jgi:hypothetical protein